MDNAHDTQEAPQKGTLGQYLARRLVEIGVRDVFSVPGDSNLTLLDYFVAEPQLNLIGCCNELNAGYAADGYARAKGVGACIVTFTVGGLSLINAIAGAYSEGLPVICIVGGPHSKDFCSGRVLHHTTGVSSDFDQELRCFQNVTCAQAVVRSLDGAQELVDNAILMALKESKPVYISICCNLPGITHATLAQEPTPYLISPSIRISNQWSLEESTEATANFLNKAEKPVIVCGSMLRVAKDKNALIELIDASGYAFAVMLSSKGLVPELHPNFIGTYWGAISSEYCQEIVEAADAYVVVNPGFNDISTLGYTLLIKERAVMVHTNSVSVGNGSHFGEVSMDNFMSSLAKKLKKNTTAIENYYKVSMPNFMNQLEKIMLQMNDAAIENHYCRRSTYIHRSKLLIQGSSCSRGEPLKVSILFKHIQDMLSGDNTVIAEAGDSWFNCQKLHLPENCRFEVQLQYASIGWSVGATLGYAQGAKDKRLITCMGDGSFQMAAQEVSTMIHCGQNNIIFLLNNGGYTTEAKIHDGPYNVIKNWDYTKLVDAIHNGDGNCWTAKVSREDELIKAIAAARGAKKKCLCFIEVILPKDDSSREVVEFGAQLYAANTARSCPH
ncbi:hypothetical protein Sjap_000446 [Stephania japonica]|uniref:pyruvate decarboxylase n=1 Tax=Stephania japonica TaxID=461633 RepID=A0AAP0PU11_9MAGN